MNIKFHKYQGAGNDFIIIDNRNQLYDLTSSMVQQLCDRRFGIGADGLMLLENCPDYDFLMRYFNSDGGEASLCGNGSRCIVDFAYRLGLFTTTTHFWAVDGMHEGQITPEGVKVKMQDVQKITVAADHYLLDTGSPHYVRFVGDAFHTDVYQEGKTIRNLPLYQPKGVNVNFITPTPEGIRIATYERGVENETLACGTGCVAAALAVASENNDVQNTYHLIAKGGNLKVSFKRLPDGTFTDLWLEGPAEEVFKGEIIFLPPF